jgi:hypothetical protein
MQVGRQNSQQLFYTGVMGELPTRAMPVAAAMRPPLSLNPVTMAP